MAASCYERDLPGIGFSRIRDLPTDEQRPFARYLIGKAAPTIPGIPEEDQDAYHWIDYKNWKKEKNMCL
jgi:hypothetical protein